MARSNLVINVEFRANTQQLRGAMSSVRGLAREGANLQETTVRLQTPTKQLFEDIHRGRVGLKQARMGFRNLGNIVRQQNAIVNGAITGYKQLSDGSLEVTRVTGDMSAQYATLGQQIGMAGHVMDGFGRNLVRVGKNIQWTGRQLTVGLTVPMMLLGRRAVAAAREVDEQMVRLTKVYNTSTDDISGELDRLEKSILETAVGTSEAFGTSAAASVELGANFARMGFQAREAGGELEDVIELTEELMFLGEVEVDTASDLVRTIFASFGRDIDRTREILMEFNAVEAQTTISMNELADAIPAIAPLLATFNLEATQGAAMLAAMHERGLDANESVNALRFTMSRILDPTNRAVEAFEEIGVNLPGLVESAGGDMWQIMENLADVFLEIPEERIDIFIQTLGRLVGQRQASRFIVLMDAMGEAGRGVDNALTTALGTIGQYEDNLARATREQDRMRESASGMASILQAQIESLLAEAGEPMMQFMNWFRQQVVTLLEWFNNLGESTQAWVRRVAGAAALAGPLTMLFGLLTNLVGTTITAAGNVLKLATGFRQVTHESAAANQAFDGINVRLQHMEDLIRRNATNITVFRTELSKTGMTTGQVAAITRNMAGAQSRLQVALAGTGKNFLMLGVAAIPLITAFKNIREEGELTGTSITAIGMAAALTAGQLKAFFSSFRAAGFLAGPLVLAMGKFLAIVAAIGAAIGGLIWLFNRFRGTQRDLSTSTDILSERLGVAESSLERIDGAVGNTKEEIDESRKEIDKFTESWNRLSEDAKKITTFQMQYRLVHEEGMSPHEAAQRIIDEFMEMGIVLDIDVRLNTIEMRDALMLSTQQAVEEALDPTFVTRVFGRGGTEAAEAWGQTLLVAFKNNIEDVGVMLGEMQSELATALREADSVQEIEIIEDRVRRMTSAIEEATGFEFTNLSDMAAIREDLNELVEIEVITLNEKLNILNAITAVQAGQHGLNQMTAVERMVQLRLERDEISETIASLEHLLAARLHSMPEFLKQQFRDRIQQYKDERSEIHKTIQSLQKEAVARRKAEVEAAREAAAEAADAFIDGFEDALGDTEVEPPGTDQNALRRQALQDAQSYARAWVSALRSAVTSEFRLVADIIRRQFRDQLRAEEDALQLRHDKELEQIDERLEAKANAYDEEIAALEELQEEEDRLDRLRQWAFRREQARIEHMHTMRGLEIDLQIALARGQTGEAMQIRQRQQMEHSDFVAGEIEAEAERRKEQIRDERQAKIDQLRDEKRAMEEHTRNIRREREKQLRTAQDAFRRENELRQRSFDHQMDMLMQTTPRTAAEYSRLLGQLGSLLDDFGAGTLAPVANEYRKITGRSIHSGFVNATNQARKAMAESKAWENLGNSIVKDTLKGMGFSNKEIRDIVSGRGGSVTSGGSFSDSGADPGYTPQATQPTTRVDTTSPDRRTSTPDPHRTIYIRHGGGDISRGSGFPGLKPDEAVAILQKGEYVIDRDTVGKVGTSFFDNLISGGLPTFHDGGYLAEGMISGMGKGITGLFENYRDNMSSLNNASDIVQAVFDSTGGFGPSGAESFRRAGAWPPRRWATASPNTLAAQNFIRRAFRGVMSAGLGLNRGVVASDHSWGKAIDAMVAPLGRMPNAEQRATGWNVANWFVNNPGEFGTKYVIWDKKINSGRGWREYTRYGNNPGPTLGHYDHVHVSFLHKGGMVGKDGALTIPALRDGARINHDNTLANLHRGETVLTKPLSEQLEQGIDRIANGGGVTYHIPIEIGEFHGTEENIDTLARKIGQEIERNEYGRGDRVRRFG